MKTIQASGEYKVKSTGEAVAYTFEYEAYENLQEAIDTLGEEKVFKLVQRMVKVDASNTAREGAKVENGHSTRKAMSEEEKAEAKQERATDRALLAKLKALSAHDRQKLGL